MKQMFLLAAALVASAPKATHEPRSLRYKPTKARFSDDEGGSGSEKKEGSDSGSGTDAGGSGNQDGKGKEGDKSKQGDDAAESDKDAAYWQAQAKEARKEAQGLRSRTKEAEEKVKGFEDEKKSDLEKAEERAIAAETATKQAKAEAKSARIEAAASRLGFADPKDATRLLDPEAAGENGENAEKALAELLKSKPYLKADSKSLPKRDGTPGASGGDEKDKVDTARKQFPFLDRRMSQIEAEKGKG